MEQIIIVFAILVIFIVYNIYYKKDLLLPGNLFALVILFTYMISCFRFSDLQHKYGIDFTLKILFLILCFIVGSKIKKEVKEKNFAYYSKRLKYSIYILFILVTGSFLVMWFKLGPPPLLSKTDRAKYFVSGFGTVYLMIDVLSFLIVYDLLDKKIIGKKSYIMLLVILAMIVLMSNKFQIIYFICQYLVMYNVMKKKIKITSLLKLLLIALIIFVIYYAYIYNGMYISNDEMYKVNKINFSSKYSLLTNPYLYIAFNYENLYHYMSLEDIQYGFGYYMLEDILDTLELKEFLYDNSDALSMQWKNHLQYQWLTTGTIFREFYMDFGYIGTCILTFLLGYICQKSYIKCYSYKSIFFIYFYATNMVSIFLAFFTNEFVSINYLINLMCAYIITRICFKDNSKKQID